MAYYFDHFDDCPIEGTGNWFYMQIRGQEEVVYIKFDFGYDHFSCFVDQNGKSYVVSAPET